MADRAFGRPETDRLPRFELGLGLCADMDSVRRRHHRIFRGRYVLFNSQTQEVMNKQEQRLVYKAIIYNDEFKFGVVCSLASALSPATSISEEQMIFTIGLAERIVKVIRPYDIARFVAMHDPSVNADTIFNLWVVAAQQLDLPEDDEKTI